MTTIITHHSVQQSSMTTFTSITYLTAKQSPMTTVITYYRVKQSPKTTVIVYYTVKQ
jgi:hypothetical protein